MTIDNYIMHLEKDIKEYESLIASNDDYNFSQLEWKQSLYEYRQLAKWLTDYKKLLGAIKDINADIYKIRLISSILK